VADQSQYAKFDPRQEAEPGSRAGRLIINSRPALVQSPKNLPGVDAIQNRWSGSHLHAFLHAVAAQGSGIDRFTSDDGVTT
jgi:hypothetical protein